VLGHVRSNLLGRSNCGKICELSFGRSSSVDGSVRKLGLGAAGTGGVISTDSLVSGGVV
jgi:hypothetical protein